MHDFINEAGELLIDAAALRFEDSLDEQSARERWDEDFYADYPDECPHCGSDECEDEDGECIADDEGLQNFGGEDSWLDGSYEE